MTARVPNPRNQGSLARSYSPQAQALFSRYGATIPIDRKIAIDNCIRNLIADGAWTVINSFVILAAHTPSFALLNWRGDPNNDAALLGSPTFTADKGYSGFDSGKRVKFPNLATINSPYSYPGHIIGGQFDWAVTGFAGSSATLLESGSGQSILNTTLNTNSGPGLSLSHIFSGKLAVMKSSAVLGTHKFSLALNGINLYNTNGTGLNWSGGVQTAASPNGLVKLQAFSTVIDAATDTHIRSITHNIANYLRSINASEP